MEFSFDTNDPVNFTIGTNLTSLTAKSCRGPFIEITKETRRVKLQQSRLCRLKRGQVRAVPKGLPSSTIPAFPIEASFVLLSTYPLRNEEGMPLIHNRCLEQSQSQTQRLPLVLYHRNLSQPRQTKDIHRTQRTSHQ